MEGYTGFTRVYASEDLIAPGISKWVKFGAVKYNSAVSGTAVKIGSVPAGAVIVRAVCVVGKAFNAGTGNTLALGSADAADALLGANDITAGTAAAYSKAMFYDAGAGLDIYAKYTQSGDAASAGEAEFWAEIIRTGI